MKQVNLVVNNYIYGTIKNARLKQLDGSLSYELVDTINLSRNSKKVTFNVYDEKTFDNFLKVRGLQKRVVEK